MKIMVVITSLQPGGTERVISLMANYWVRTGWTVTFVISFETPEGAFFELSPAVRQVCLGSNRRPYAGLWFALRRHIQAIVRLRRAMVDSAPDCVLAFGHVHAVRSIMAALGLGIPLVVCEQDDPSYLRRTRHGKMWALFRLFCYRMADAVVVLTQAGKDFFDEKTREKIKVIPNPVPMDLVKADDEEIGLTLPLHKKSIAAMGRFVREKRFDLLLRAFAIVAKNHDCSLIIVGDGPLREELQSLVDRLGLADRVTMPGFIRHPWLILKDAYSFVLSSEVEAFGLVIVEAMAHGIPVISFDCPNGPREIIRNGIDGILVPPLDVEALAQAIEDLLKNESKRHGLSARCIEVTERFKFERVMDQWNEALTAVCREHKGN